jgi:DNA-binding transcriptional ArsR family regulator
MNHARRISNLERSSEALMKILKVLSDGKWHQNGELAEKTKVSSATLAKHLKKLRKLKLIRLRIDSESGKYPEPRYYIAEPELVTYAGAKIRTEELSQRIKPALLESKDPLLLLDAIHLYSYANLESLLQELKTEEGISDSKMSFLAEFFVWEPYMVLTRKVLESSREIVDEIDFAKLHKEKLKRLKWVTEEVLKLRGE